MAAHQPKSFGVAWPRLEPRPPPGRGVRPRLVRRARGAWGPAAGRALPQPAAGPDRGADLWPRMAARLRQAAAPAVVADRGDLSAVRKRYRPLFDRPGNGGGGFRSGLGAGAAAGRAARGAG